MPAWLPPSLHSSFYLQVISLEQFFPTTTVEGRLQESRDFCHTHLCILAHSLTLSSHLIPFCQSLDSVNASCPGLLTLLFHACRLCRYGRRPPILLGPAAPCPTADCHGCSAASRSGDAGGSAHRMGPAGSLPCHSAALARRGRAVSASRLHAHTNCYAFASCHVPRSPHPPCNRPSHG